MNDENENRPGLKKIMSQAESLLFVSNKPMRAKELAKILEQQESDVTAALELLAEERKNSGVIILQNNGQYQMATHGDNSPAVKNFLNAELREKLTDATVEVLAIIAYRQPISKAELEAIRGVNSQYSIRNLLMRGLIEKVQNPQDARSFLYQTTTEFLMHLGLQSAKELPEFESLVSQIKLPDTPQAAQATGQQPAEMDANIQEQKILTENQSSQADMAISPILTMPAGGENLPTPSAEPIGEADNEEFEEEDSDGEEDEENE